MKKPQYGKTYFFSIIGIIIGKRGGAMLDYSPMWGTMKEKGITQYRLLKGGIDNKTLDTIKKNGNITLLTLEKLCNILECTSNEVIRFQK